MKNNTIDVYIDFKSPYAYLAIEPSINFAKENKLNINWLPYVLEIPDYLGSAKVDANGKVIESNRNDHQWRRVKYSYMDCRRYANTRNITVRGPQKIWNTKLISIALLWTKINNYEHTESFINYVFKVCFIRYYTTYICKFKIYIRFHQNTISNIYKKNP